EMLAEQVLQNSKLSDDQVLIIRTVVGKNLRVAAVCEDLVAQHSGIHNKECRGGFPPKGKSYGGKGPFRNYPKGKGYGYHAELPEDGDTYGYPDEAYHAWDAYSQSLGGFEDEVAAYYQGATQDYDYVEEDEAIHNAFAALVQDGFDENQDPEAAEYVAELLQAEGEAYMVRQQAAQRGYSGFQGKKYEFRGEMSIEERALGQRRLLPQGLWKGEMPKRVSLETAGTTTTASKGKSKSKDGSARPRPVYFAISEPVPAAPAAMMAERPNYNRVPPPSSLDTEPGPPRTRSSLDGVAPPATLSSLLAWSGGRPRQAEDKKDNKDSGIKTANPSALPRASSAMVAVDRAALAEVPSGAPFSGRLVDGVDMDQDMLIRVLRANSDVVLDQMIAEARTMDTADNEGQLLITQGPMEAVESAEPAANIIEDTRDEKDVKDDAVPAPRCLHERTTTKGTKRYYFIRSCLDCKMVLERTQKAQSEKAPEGKTPFKHSPESCAHLNVTRQGTNAHTWKWYCKDCGTRREGRQGDAQASNFGDILGGALAGNFAQGPDSHAVKVMELAGTVVMVQESGGIPVRLDRLPGIVQKCADIYRQKAGLAAGSSFLQAPPIQPGPAPPDSSSTDTKVVRTPLDKPGDPSEAGISDDTRLQSGKYKGSSFKEVYDHYPEYND
ncbi:TY4B-J, partial [Symbiodinium sp. CCMP2456]